MGLVSHQPLPTPALLDSRSQPRRPSQDFLQPLAPLTRPVNQDHSPCHLRPAHFHLISLGHQQGRALPVRLARPASQDHSLCRPVRLLLPPHLVGFRHQISLGRRRQALAHFHQPGLVGQWVARRSRACQVHFHHNLASRGNQWERPAFRLEWERHQPKKEGLAG